MIEAMRVALLCASGGHLTEMMCVKEAWKKYDHFIVTLSCPRTESMKETKYLIENPEKNLKSYPKSLRKLFFMMAKEKPEVIISTGLGWFDIFIFLLAKLTKSHTIYIESWCRTDSCTGTGNILKHIADEFLVQWPELAGDDERKVKFRGGVI